MEDWDDLKHFLAVHREGSLVGAGRRLKVDPTTVGRRVGHLEDQLGVALFLRARDGWRLTAAGRRMLPAAERAEEATHEVQAAVSDARQRIEGRVRLTTVEVLASRLVVPVLPALRRAHPGIRLDVWATPRLQDLLRGEADLALRVGRPVEEELLARRVATATQRPYAGRRWLERHGIDDPAAVTDLDGKEVLFLLVPETWADGLGRVTPVLRTTAGSTLLAAAVRGLGVAMLPEVLAAREPELVPLPGLGVERELDLWLVLHPETARLARIRAVADFLVDRLTSVPMP
jgi:DNA-binding transcriptional LysR family regulator